MSSASFHNARVEIHSKNMNDKTSKNIDGELTLSNTHKTNFHNAWPVITDEVRVDAEGAVYLHDLDW